MPMRRIAAAAVATLVTASGQAMPTGAAGRLADVPMTHIGIVVSDLERAARAYAGVLGVAVPRVRAVKAVRDPAGSRGDRRAYPRTATIGLNGVAIELLEPQGGASPWRDQLEAKGPGLHHIAFGVADRAGHLRHLQEAGGVVRVGGEAGGAMTDVDFGSQLGFTIELEEKGAVPASTVPLGASFASNAVVHISAMVPDVEKSGRLLARVLGVELPPTVVVKMGSLVYPESYRGDRQAAPKHVTFRLPNILLELTEPQGGSSPWRDHLEQHGPSLHHMAFRVSSMADSIRHLEQHGGRLVLGGPGVSYAYVDLRPNPLGMTFELNGPAPPRAP